MKTLVIASIYDYSGKTMVALGVGRRLQVDGFKMGYMKPFGRYPTTANSVVMDSDAAFVCDVLGLKDPPEFVSPIMITQDTIIRAYRGENLQLNEKIIHAHEELSTGKDVLIMGWDGTLNQGNLVGVSIREMVERLDACVIVPYKCQGDIFVDDLLSLIDLFGDRMAGVILNQVEFSAIDHIKNNMTPLMTKSGLNVLGIFMSDPIIMSVTIRELAVTLNGEVLCGEERLDDLVGRFSVGAMNVEEAMTHFIKLKDKAVITGGDREDIQCAALETDTKCLVLTGNIHPSDKVVARAKERDVPVIVVEPDTLAVVRQVEDIMSMLRIRDARKIHRAIELVNDELDFPLLYERLGLNGSQ